LTCNLKIKNEIHNLKKFFYGNEIKIFEDFIGNLSGAKSVYVLTKGHMIMFQNKGRGGCVKCFKEFEENDIIATSTSQHYCYDCAIKINLVTGKIIKDLCIDKFIPEVLHHIKSLTKKLSISKEIGEYAKILINTVFDKTHYVSKNKLGLACAAISLSYQIKNQDSSLDNRLPVSHFVLQKNLQLLQKNLKLIDIYSLSQRIQEMKK
jgi:hypothetical protein